MTAIGKLLVLSSFVAALSMLTWATGLYVELNVPLEPATGPKSLPAPAESI